MGQHNASTGGIVTGRWGDSYGGIGRCNTFLAKIDEVPGTEAADIYPKNGRARLFPPAHYIVSRWPPISGDAPHTHPTG